MLMPVMRAAEGLPPTAKVLQPNLVRFSRIELRMIQMIKIRMGVGKKPNRFPPTTEKGLISWVTGLPLVMTSAKPRAMV